MSLLLVTSVAACSGSGSDDLTEQTAPPINLPENPDTTENPVNAGNTDTPDNTDNSDNSVNPNNPDPTDKPDSVNANLVTASTFPDTDANGNVVWAFDAVTSGLEIVVQPFVEMPLASNGSPARWNAMSSFTDRLFAVDEQDGRVYEITNRSAQLWFDIGDAVQSHTGRSLDISNAFHGGVRGIAFHPDFLTNGKFYASIMEERPTETESHHYISDNSGISADSVLVEWTANTTSYQIDASSYREVFRVGVPEYDHPIKQIAFNPSVSNRDTDYGNLYIAHGDGSVASTLAGTGLSNDALGKILRINPLQSGLENYSIPADNPFVADDSLPNEVYSYGHRNPHHLAFSATGHLLATEDGRDNIDEVNLITSGANYGWAMREGAYIHLDVGTLLNGIASLPGDDAINGFVYPAAQFGHHGEVGATFTGEALGGGFVVENGSALDGQFFYIDFPKSSLLFHSGLDDILAAKTTGTPSELTNAQTYIATVKFDHDNNPDTAPLDNDLKQIVQSASGYVNVNNRIDVRILQGSQGELYLSSKRNNMIYLVSNSIPNAL